MKVLKSELAKKVLADPRAVQQLRQFLTERDQDGVVIQLCLRGRAYKLKPVLVPKAT